jgi:hypothetical protein
MRRIASVAALAASLATAIVMAPAAPAAASPWGYGRPFSVEHTRGCIHSATTGSLFFAATQIGRAHTLEVTGTLTDERPPGCDDPGLTYAEFTANVYSSAVDSRTVWLNQQPVAEFAFVLTTGTLISLFEINSVDIRLCHTLGPDLPPISCEWQRYVTPPPVLTG